MTPSFRAWLFDESGSLRSMRAGPLDSYAAEGLADDLRHAGRSARLRIIVSDPCDVVTDIVVPDELARASRQGFRVEIFGG